MALFGYDYTMDVQPIEGTTRYEISGKKVCKIFGVPFWSAHDPFLQKQFDTQDMNSATQLMREQINKMNAHKKLKHRERTVMLFQEAVFGMAYSNAKNNEVATKLFNSTREQVVNVCGGTKSDTFRKFEKLAAQALNIIKPTFTDSKQRHDLVLH